MRPIVTPTGVERIFSPEEIIVTKTDLHGRITYANEVFCRVSALEEADVVGQPHSLIRHPEMPRGVFRLLWDRLQRGQEVFAYVKNLAADGQHYWVFAHVTPTFDDLGRIRSFHSSRRSPTALRSTRSSRSTSRCSRRRRRTRRPPTPRLQASRCSWPPPRRTA